MTVSLFDYECIVIGGGPGGLSAALHLRHFRRAVAVVRSGVPRAAWIPKVHNLAGHTKGLTGPQLLKALESQVRKLKVPIMDGTGKVERLKKWLPSGDQFSERWQKRNHCEERDLGYWCF